MIGLRGWKAEGDAGSCCYRCMANCTTIPYCDFSLNAAWRHTLLSSEQFLRQKFENGEYISGLFSLPGFRAEYIGVDLMHCSCLGVVQYLLGAVLLELFQEMHGVYLRAHETLSEILCMIRAASKRIEQPRVPINNLTLTMLRGKKSAGAKLATKASEGRNLLPCVKYMLQKFLPLDTTHATLRLQCVSKLDSMYSILEKWESPNSGRLAAAEGRKCLLLLSELVDEFNRGREWQTTNFFMWRIVPKMHMMCHCLEDCVAVSGNPRSSWCYCDESEIGAARRVAEASHPSTLSCAVIDKHRLG